MKKDELEHMMEDALEKAKSLLLRDGYLAPIAFLFSEKEVHIISLTFKNQEEKEEQVTLLRNMAKLKDADAIFLVIESWYVTSDKMDINIIPSKHPMRKECIFIVGECEEGNATIIQKFEKEKDKIIFGEKDNINIFGSRFNFGIKDRKRDNINKKTTDDVGLNLNLNPNLNPSVDPNLN